MALPRGQGQPKMVPRSPADLRSISLRPYGSDLKRSKMDPRGLQATFFRLRRPPRALQEPFKMHSGAFSVDASMRTPFWIPFWTPFWTPAPQKSLKIRGKKNMGFENACPWCLKFLQQMVLENHIFPILQISSSSHSHVFLIYMVR